MSIQAAPEIESQVVSAPQRIGVKVFVEDQEAFDRTLELYPDFAREIRRISEERTTRNTAEDDS